MLTIDQLKDLKDDRAKFQAVTGLTWDPTTITDQEFLKKIQWYFPKGAGFDKEHIASDKALIESLKGDASDPYYNVEEGDGQNTPPEPVVVKTINVSDNAALSDYNIKPEDAAAADENGDGVVKIVSTPVQEKEGKYMTDAEENYTTVYAVQDNDNVEDDSNA